MSIVELVQVASAIGTVAAAVVGWAAASAARSAARAGNQQALAAQRQVDLAVEASENASRAVREAARSRADQRAPSVLVVASAPQGGPLILPTPVSGSLFSKSNFASSRAVDRLINEKVSDDCVIWISGSGFVANEGNLSALISSENDIAWSPDDDVQTQYMGLPIVSAQAVGSQPQPYYLLPARSVVTFKWAIGNSFAFWKSSNSRLPSKVTITCRPVGNAGVTDIFVTDFLGMVIKRFGGKDEWVIDPDWPDSLVVLAHPPVRSYDLSE